MKALVNRYPARAKDEVRRPNIVVRSTCLLKKLSKLNPQPEEGIVTTQKHFSISSPLCTGQWEWYHKTADVRHHKVTVTTE